METKDTIRWDSDCVVGYPGCMVRRRIASEK